MDCIRNNVAQSIDDVNYNILAWQKSSISAKYLFNEEELVLYNAVICAAYKDSAGVSQWALLLLTRDEQLAHLVPWQLCCNDESSPMRFYKERPTNEEIYEFLAGRSTIETQLFLGSRKRVKDLRGVPMQFVQGDVLEETWESVIGEKPTKFFPGEE